MQHKEFRTSQCEGNEFSPEAVKKRIEIYWLIRVRNLQPKTLAELAVHLGGTDP